MERHDWRCRGGTIAGGGARVPAAATGLILVEQVLMDDMGSPMMLLRMLGDLGQLHCSYRFGVVPES
jgi:hypothetical protein